MRVLEKHTRSQNSIFSSQFDAKCCKSDKFLNVKKHFTHEKDRNKPNIMTTIAKIRKMFVNYEFLRNNFKFSFTNVAMATNTNIRVF